MAKSSIEKAVHELSRLEKLASACSAKEKLYFERFLKGNYDLARAAPIDLDRAAAVVNEFYADLAAGPVPGWEEKAVAIKGRAYIIINGGANLDYEEFHQWEFAKTSPLVRVGFICEGVLLYPHFHGPYIPRFVITDGKHFDTRIYFDDEANSFVSTTPCYHNSSSKYLRIQYQEHEPTRNTVIRIMPTSHAELLLMPRKKD